MTDTATRTEPELVTRTYFVHDRGWRPSKNGGGTQLFRRTLALAMDSDGWIHVGIAWCSDSDQFCRRTGRTIAEGRMKGRAQKHYYRVWNIEDLQDKLPGDILGGSLEKCFDMLSRALPPEE